MKAEEAKDWQGESRKEKPTKSRDREIMGWWVENLEGSSYYLPQVCISIEIFWMYYYLQGLSKSPSEVVVLFWDYLSIFKIDTVFSMEGVFYNSKVTNALISDVCSMLFCSYFKGSYSFTNVAHPIGEINFVNSLNLS